MNFFHEYKFISSFPDLTSTEILRLPFLLCNRSIILLGFHIYLMGGLQNMNEIQIPRWLFQGRGRQGKKLAEYLAIVEFKILS